MAHRAARLPLLPLLLCVVLAACAGTFKMKVRSPQPQSVGTVWVLFGPEGQLVGKQGMSEVTGLIKRSSLQEYYAFAEYEVDPLSGAWTQLTTSPGLPKQIRLSLPEDEPGLLVVRLRRGLLEARPDLAVAVVVRTSENEFHSKAWPSAYVAESSGELEVYVNGQGVSEGGI